MEFNVHSKDRFLPVLSPPADTSIFTASAADDEFKEDDVFWTGHFAENKTRSAAAASSSLNHRRIVSRMQFGKQEDKPGILAALSDESKVKVLGGKPSFSPSAAKNVRVIQSTTLAPKLNFSAPVNVPMMNVNARRKRALFGASDDEEDDAETLPPHEIVARGSALTPNTTFSMLEGAGRTLKGRDLRQVRNAVFWKTGFLD